jgi:hypothetical protein
MSNQNTNVLRSLVVLVKGNLKYYSVGRAIRNVHRYKLAMVASGPSHDEMGAWLGNAYGFDACVVALEAGNDADLAEAIARLRANGLRSEREVMAARPRTEKFRSLVCTLRDCGLKVSIRNADVDGETKRLTINGTDDARASFLAKCSDEQAEWVKATFVAVADRPGIRTGIVSVLD